MGERGSVRELWDLGDSTLPRFAFAAWDAVRGGVDVAVFARFGFLSWAVGSSSLSERMAISELRLFALFLGDNWIELEGLGGETGISRGTEGRAPLVSATCTSASGESRDRGVSFAIVASAYFVRSSPRFAFLKLIGIRLMRRSIRDRRSVA